MSMDEALFSQLAKGISEQNLVELLKEMISIKSENPFNEEPRPGYREKEMAEFLGDHMSQLGLEVEFRSIRQGRSNVFGRLKGAQNEQTLMLAGHMDTARTDGYPEAYDVKLGEGKISGRGSCDMKAAFAAYLEVMRLIKEAEVRLKGDVILAGVIDEEYQMLGSKDVGKNGPKAHRGIIGEPTELRVCPANKGRVSLILRTFGKAAHSSIPEQGDNAILRMVRALQALSSYNEDLLKQTSHPLCGHGRFSPGVIHGGVQVNTVPDRCDLEIDRRTLPGEGREKVYEELRLRLDPLVREDRSFKYILTDPTWFILPNEVPSDDPITRSLLEAYVAVTGKPAQLGCFAGGTDAPYMGFPTVICGPGSINQAHTTQEFVRLEELDLAVRIYLRVVLGWLA
jgi:acetylornithine deacetylase/succinyl-diaminopimelate desuccinylase family protein